MRLAARGRTVASADSGSLSAAARSRFGSSASFSSCDAIRCPLKKPRHCNCPKRHRHRSSLRQNRRTRHLRRRILRRCNPPPPHPRITAAVLLRINSGKYPPAASAVMPPPSATDRILLSRKRMNENHQGISTSRPNPNCRWSASFASHRGRRG